MVFLMFCEAEVSLNSAVESVRPRTLAKPLATCRHALQYIRTGKFLPSPPYSSIHEHYFRESYILF